MAVLTFTAIYRGGAFVPQQSCDLPEETVVEISVQTARVAGPSITDPAKRAEVLHAVVDRMRRNPIPADAPPLTREALHARR